MNTKDIFYIALIILLVLVGIYAISAVKSKLNEKDTLYANSLDTLEFVKEELGQKTYRISLLETTNINTIKELASRDSSINWLTDVIKEKDRDNNKLRNALVIQSQTISLYVDSITNTVVEYITLDSVVYPTYEREFRLRNNEDIDDKQIWQYGIVKLGKTIFEIQTTNINKYEVTIGKERKNIFHKWKSYAEIKTLNPYDNVQTIRVYSLKEGKTKRFVFGPQLGFGLCMGGTSRFGYTGIYIGIGVTVKVFEF